MHDEMAEMLFEEEKEEDEDTETFIVCMLNGWLTVEVNKPIREQILIVSKKASDVLGMKYHQYNHYLVNLNPSAVYFLVQTAHF